MPNPIDDGRELSGKLLIQIDDFICQVEFSRILINSLEALLALVCEYVYAAASLFFWGDFRIELSQVFKYKGVEKRLEVENVPKSAGNLCKVLISRN